MDTNGKNTIIENLKELAKTQPEQAINNLLHIVEENLPTKAIYIKIAENDEKEKTYFSDEYGDIVRSTLSLMFENQIKQGKSPEQAKAYLKTVEPFNNYEDLIDELQ